MDAAVSDTLAGYRARAEQALERLLPADATPARLYAAMRYATLGGGKRIRAGLAYAAGQALGASLAHLDSAACAVELIHAYSLIHDDLPCMDDDDLRRGKPTCHRAFDEATALLAGDALQTLAFETLAQDPYLTPAVRIRMIERLARAAGAQGMVGGQAIDLESVGRHIPAEQLEDMHARKTGALIRSAVTLGALAAEANAELLAALDVYAQCTGLAFQIMDDVLDVEGDTATLGKTRGADQARNKPTYAALVGLAESKRMAAALHARALESLRFLGDNGRTLAAIAGFVIRRSH